MEGCSVETEYMECLIINYRLCRVKQRILLARKAGLTRSQDARDGLYMADQNGNLELDLMPSWIDVLDVFLCTNSMAVWVKGFDGANRGLCMVIEAGLKNGLVT